MIKTSFTVVATSCALCVTWLAPVTPIIFLLLGFILFDTIMGVSVSIIKKRPILSRKLQRFIVKSLLYVATLLAFYGIDSLLINDIMLTAFTVPLLLTKMWATLLCTVEIFSIDEKVRAINKNQGLIFYFNRTAKQIADMRKKISNITENQE